MRRGFLPFLLIFCGFAVTETAQARPKTVPDQVVAVAEDGSFTLRDAGPAILSSVLIQDPTRVVKTLRGLQTIDVKNWGQDRYNRARVILFLPGAKESVQEQLLANGSVITYDRYAITKPWQQAEDAGQGAWKNGLILTPEQTFDHIGEFHVVRGTIRRVYTGRDRIELNFGDDWKTDFSLRIPRKSWRSFKKLLPFEAGWHVMARGAIFEDHGPMIELTRPEQIELLGGVTPKGTAPDKDDSGDDDAE